MTYLKTLIALTMFALLTACAGGVAITNNTTIIPPAATCTANPFTTGCTTTLAEQATFCRDASKTTTTKTADCAPTVIRVCGEDVFDGLCTTPTEPQAETFCRDTTKTPSDKATNCAPTVSRVCGDDPFDAGLCFADNTYAPARVQIRATCTNADGASPPRDALCPTIVAMTCTENPFLAECLVGDAGAETGTYGLARATQITENCVGENGEGFGDVFHRACNGIMEYTDERARIIDACTSGTENNANCTPETIVQVCNSNPYNAAFCFGDIDYSAKRAEELAECRTDNGRPSCVGAAATTCTDNPFQENLCFIGTTYMGDRDTQTQNCRDDVPSAPNCMAAQTIVCNANKFDAFCMGATDYIDAQLNECALATATTAQCNMVFATPLAGCLADPFSVACDAEPTFTASKVAVRTSRFGYCETDQTSDVRCTGYRTCNVSATFAPLTCGADFNPERMVFCGVTANAFDPLCTTNNLIDAAAQLAYCKLPSTDAFDVNGVCDGSEFKQARIEFCIATPATKVCNDDVRGEGLMKEPVPTDPCANGGCAEYADLPTYPTAPAERATPTDDFADGFLNVTLIAPTSGALLNQDGTDNTTIDTTNFPANARLVADSLKFGRRGGRGSSDDDGFVWFTLLKGATGEAFAQSSSHAAILPTTNLGAPLTEAPTTAVWPGHFYRANNRIDAADFYVTFESLPNNQIGRIGFANPTKDGIGTGNERPLFARLATDLQIDMTFDAKGVLSGTMLHANFGTSQPATGLIGTEGAVAVSVTSPTAIGSSTVGFTATNPDGRAIPVIDPCIGGLAGCYGTHAFWLGNARNSSNTQFLKFRSASAGVATADEGLVNLITGDATVINALVGDGITVEPNYTVTLDDLNDVSNSEDIKSGFGLAFALNGDSSINNYYIGLLSGTNVGAPFTNTNQPAAEWTGEVSLYGSASNNFRNVAITLAVTFDDTNGGTIGHATDTYTYFNNQRDADHGDIQRFSINGKFDANGVIYGRTTYRYLSQGVNNEELSLSGLIGVNGAVAVFGGFSGGDSASYVGGFVARPTPSP